GDLRRNRLIVIVVGSITQRPSAPTEDTAIADQRAHLVANCQLRHVGFFHASGAATLEAGLAFASKRTHRIRADRIHVAIVEFAVLAFVHVLARLPASRVTLVAEALETTVAVRAGGVD